MANRFGDNQAPGTAAPGTATGVNRFGDRPADAATPTPETPESSELAGGRYAAQAVARMLGAPGLAGPGVLGMLGAPWHGGGSDVPGGIVKGAERTALTIGDLMRRGAARTMGLQAQPLLEERPDLRAATSTTTPGEAVGFGAEQLGEFFVPIGTGKIRAAANAGKLARFGLGALREGIDTGIKTLAQTGSPQEAAETGAIAGPIGGATEVVLPGLGRVLKQWAQSQYARMLHPLGRAAKEVAEEQVPRIMDEGWRAATAFTKHGLAEKWSATVKDLGQQINQEYQALDATTRTRLKPIYDGFFDWIEKEAFTAKGGLKDDAILTRGLQEIYDFERAIRHQVGSASPSEIWEIRQTLDKYVFRNRLTPDESVAAANQIKKAFGNILRKELNSQHPSIAALNDKFHLWKSASQLIERNILNEFGQYRFARTMGYLGRFMIGAAVGGGEEYGRGGSPFTIGAAAAAVGLAAESPQWRMVSSMVKNQVANLLLRGEGRAAADLVARAVGRHRAAEYQARQPWPSGTPSAAAAATAPRQDSAVNVPSAASPTGPPSGLAVKPGQVVQSTPPSWSLVPSASAAPGGTPPMVPRPPDDRPSPFAPVHRLGEAPPRPSTLVPVSPAAPPAPAPTARIESAGVPRTSPIIGTPQPQTARPQTAAPRAGRYEAWDRTKEWMSDFQKFGSLYGVPPAIIRAVMHNESHGNPNVPRGKAGEVGVMQMMERTAKDTVDPITRQKGVNRADPHDSIRGATILLSQLWKRYHGDKRKVLAAYNEGQTIFDRRLKRWGDKVWDHIPKKTQDYVHNAMYVLGGGGD